jgi:hypothetical protein
VTSDDPARLAVCVRNDGYPAALELRRTYRMLSDSQAEGYGLVRIIDEWGDGYLYPAEYFEPVDLPPAAREKSPLAS